MVTSEFCFYFKVRNDQLPAITGLEARISRILTVSQDFMREQRVIFSINILCIYKFHFKMTDLELSYNSQFS